MKSPPGGAFPPPSTWRYVRQLPEILTPKPLKEVLGPSLAEKVVTWLLGIIAGGLFGALFLALLTLLRGLVVALGLLPLLGLFKGATGAAVQQAGPGFLTALSRASVGGAAAGAVGMAFAPLARWRPAAYLVSVLACSVYIGFVVAPLDSWPSWRTYLDPIVWISGALVGVLGARLWFKTEREATRERGRLTRA